MKHHMSTYVTVPEDAGTEALAVEAAKRLGGTDGITPVHVHLSEGKFCGTFTRDWETPDEPERVTHIEPETPKE